VPIPRQKSTSARTLLSDMLYERLRDTIISGELQPGEHLRESEIEEWAGTSKTPVREALDRLNHEGFTEVLPRRVTRVSVLDDTVFADRLETFGALAVAVCRDALDLMTPAEIEAWVSAMRRTAHPSPEHPWGRLAGLLVLFESYGNATVLEIADSLVPHLKRHSVARGLGRDWVISEQHLTSLIAAARAQDAARASGILATYFAQIVDRARTVAFPNKEDR
jgi:DNA-binding GntR family transcriptional regulator